MCFHWYLSDIYSRWLGALILISLVVTVLHYLTLIKLQIVHKLYKSYRLLFIIHCKCCLLIFRSIRWCNLFLRPRQPKINFTSNQWHFKGSPKITRPYNFIITLTFYVSLLPVWPVIFSLTETSRSVIISKVSNIKIIISIVYFHKLPEVVV